MKHVYYINSLHTDWYISNVYLFNFDDYNWQLRKIPNLIFLFTIPHRFSMGLRSGEFAGQLRTDSCLDFASALFEVYATDWNAYSLHGGSNPQGSEVPWDRLENCRLCSRAHFLKSNWTGSNDNTAISWLARLTVAESQTANITISDPLSKT